MRKVSGERIDDRNRLAAVTNTYMDMYAEVLADAGHIAGLTTWMDYVVMRSCAAEIGYASAFHAEHVPVAATALAHAVTAHPDLLSSLVQLGQPQTWARVLGEALASGAHLRSRFMPGQVFSATTAANRNASSARCC